VGDLAYFAAKDDSHGLELFRTDGTVEGTELVADLEPGTAGSNPQELWAYSPAGPLLFTAYDGEHGFEFWETTGTATTTHRVDDIVPGTVSSHPRGYQRAGSFVYFTADDGEHGRELWRLPIDRLSLTAADILCPKDVTALAEVGATGAVVDYPPAKALGAASGSSVTYSAASGSRFALGTTTVEASTSDASGTAVSCRFTVTVAEQPAPPEASRLLRVKPGCSCAGTETPLMALFLLGLLRRRGNVRGA
jgi:MYXO-CTERM domain-containing protein